ncbi:MAG: PASTA domain-containing protein [Ruminococcaceae bacterium]|nr:PASTA domain-containing protein [Oscillospiraceae bacterium]
MNSSEKKKGVTKAAEGKKKNQAGTRMEMQKRLRIMSIVLLVLYLIVVARMMDLQLVRPEKWQRGATNQLLADVPLPAKRGTIYDANMEPLVQSATAWVVSLNPAMLNRPDTTESDPENGVYGELDKREAIIQLLSETLDLTPEYIEGRISGDYANMTSVKLKNKAEKAQQKIIEEYIKKAKVRSITLSTDTVRKYTRGTLASTLLGFTGIDNNGLMGLESQYDEQLSGVPGRIVSAKNALSGAMPFEYNTIEEAQQGHSLVLTIDSTVQACLEKYLMRAVNENDVRNRASGIVMNVNTGAILGMATMPDYDPADYYTIYNEQKRTNAEKIVDEDERAAAQDAARQEQWRNKAISDTYEPGSVFKPITMAAALEEGLTSLNDSFNCPGYKTVSGRRINCHKGGGHGTESLKQGMMNSCNPVFMTLGERLGGSRFFQYYKAFGFTEKTGIDLPGESGTVAGVSYHTEESLNKHAADLAVSSFGQTNTVTPIQMITAISAVVNGGYLVQPHVVGQVLDSNGNVAVNVEPVVKRQVISSSTSKIINDMLEGTVTSGTAKNCYIPGYRIGGKTGTSEKIAETAQTGIKTYVASYCAVVPSDDPEIAVLILLDDPRGAYHMGGTIAAPVARNILTEILPYLGIETIYSEEDVKRLDTIVPSLRTKSVDEAKQRLEEKNLKIRVIGDGDTVTGQIPQGGQSIPRGGTVVVTTGEEGSLPLATVPSVEGKSPREANTLITDAGLNIRFAGSGYDSSQGVAQSQSIPAGTKVEQGTVITVDFIMGGATD